MAIVMMPPLPLSSHHSLVHELGQRLVALYRPLRILERLRWGPEVEEAFFASRCKELPRIDRTWYERRSHPSAESTSHDAIDALQRDVTATLGPNHPAGQLLLSRTDQLHDVVTLLEARGTPSFAAISARLYGTSRDALADGTSLASSVAALYSWADNLEPSHPGEETLLDAEEAARLLAERFADYFGNEKPVRVFVTTAVDARAAMSGNCLKLQQMARFSLREIRLLEVHEGWVHLGTTRNAHAQDACSFLARPTPATTATQEGLAVWAELLARASHPDRLRLLAARVEAVALAEEGGDFLDTYRFFLARGHAPRDSYQHSVRLFRGSLPTGGGPFTKDLAYARGLHEVGTFRQECLQSGRLDLLPLLFTGKVSVAEVPALAELLRLGLMRPPCHLPPLLGAEGGMTKGFEAPKLLSRAA